MMAGTVIRVAICARLPTATHPAPTFPEPNRVKERLVNFHVCLEIETLIVALDSSVLL